MSMAYSYATYVSDGTDVSYNVTFPYINEEDVKGYVDGVEKEFTWLTSSTVKFTEIPPNGSYVLLKRITTRTDRLINFKDASILQEEYLNTDSKQGFYLSQEAFDAVDDCLSTNTFTRYFDAKSKQIKNIDNPTEDKDATTKEYADNLYNQAVSINVTAAAAAIKAASDAAYSEEIASAAAAAAVGIISGSPVLASGSLSYRTLADRFADVVNVKDFGAKGNGTTDDTVAIQAALTYATAFSPARAVYLPSGTYVVTAKLSIPQGTVGFTLVGDGIGSSKFSMAFDGTLLQLCDDVLFSGGDTVSTLSTQNITISGITFQCSDISKSSNGIVLGSNPYSIIHNCEFRDFDIAIDGYRLTYTKINGCEFRANSRTSATAFLRLQGVYDSGESWSPGGNISIDECDFQGNHNVASGIVGILVHSVDGLYISQTHIQSCNRALSFRPNNATTNRVITDVKVQNCYFDDPIGDGASNVTVYGTLYENTLFQEIHFYNSLFRGANIAEYGISVVVGLDSGVSNSIRGVSVHNCVFREHTNCGINVSGPSAGYARLSELTVDGNLFESENESGTFDNSAVTANCKNLFFCNNIVRDEVNSPTRAINFYGTDSTGYIKISDNVFSQSLYSGTAILIAGLFATKSIEGNIYKAGSTEGLTSFVATLATGGDTQPTCTGYYRKIGNTVFVQVNATFASTVLNGTAITISGLPYANAKGDISINAGFTGRSVFDTGCLVFWELASGASTLALKQIAPSGGVANSVVSQSGTFVPTFGKLTFHYMVAE